MAGDAQTCGPPDSAHDHRNTVTSKTPERDTEVDRDELGIGATREDVEIACFQERAEAGAAKA
jgi:hypothetical protein